MQSGSVTRAPDNSLLSSSTVRGQGSYSYIRKDCKFNSCRSRRIQSTWLQWKSYSLLVRRVWDIEIYRSRQGWDFCMSVYACVLHNSLVARCTTDGNIEGLQRLFSQGKASPFTVCLEILPDGCFNMRTLLEVRVIYSTIQLFRSLISIDWS